MTLHARLTARLTQTVTVNAYAGANVVGDPSYSTSASTYAARWDEKSHMVAGANGQDVLAKGSVIVGATSTGGLPSIGIQDKVTRPDGTIPRLLAVETPADGLYVKDFQILHYG